MSGDLIFLTGASKGIGKEIALEMAKKGCNLMLVGRDEQRLEEVAHLCGTYNKKNYVFYADLSSQQSIENAVAKALSEDSRITALINNHGIHYRSLLINVKKDDSRMEKLIDTNLRSTITLTKLLLPYITATTANNPLYRALIYVSSWVARNPLAGSTAYTASKWGILGFAHALFEEVQEQGIKVSTICPGYVDTDQIERDRLLNLNSANMIKPYDVAKAVSFILDFPNSSCPVEIQIRPQLSISKKQ